MKAFTLEVRWAAGAASGAGQGSTRSVGWGSWAVSGGGSVWLQGPRTLQLAPTAEES